MRVGIALLAVLAVGAWALLTVHLFGPASDAVGYLAAGERLDAGHLLYALEPGDRPVFVDPSFFTAPFLYPPAFALIWAPLALLPDMAGLWLWWATCVAVAGSWLIRQLLVGGWRTAIAVLILSFPLGQTFATANINGLIMVALALAWLRRDRPAQVGALLGTLTAWKLFPGMLILWLVVTRRWRAACYTIAVALLWTAAGVLLAGPDATMTYFTQVVPATRPAVLSADYLFGSSFVTYALVAVSIVLMVALRMRPRAAFVAAASTAVLAWPSLGIASLGMLTGLAPALRDPSGSAPPRRTGPVADPTSTAQARPS